MRMRTSMPNLSPHLQAPLDAFSAFFATVAQLRDPKTGCPWDLAQTHATLRRHMLEEAYEAVVEMAAPQDPKNLCEELGDVLLQVFLNAQLAQDGGTFSLQDVLEGINAKMIRRHPHVFGEGKVEGAADVLAQWEVIKAEEQVQSGSADENWFPYKKLQKIHPATHQGAAIGKAVGKLAFQFDFEEDPISDLVGEVAELQEVAMLGKERLSEIESEVGDVYFCLAQVCRKFGLDPEIAAQGGNQKVLARLKSVQERARLQGRELETLSREEMEAYWQQVKELSL